MRTFASLRLAQIACELALTTLLHLCLLLVTTIFGGFLSAALQYPDPNAQTFALCISAICLLVGYVIVRLIDHLDPPDA